MPGMCESRPLLIAKYNENDVRKVGYSLAIAMHSILAARSATESDVGAGVEIVACDVDEACLVVGRAAAYRQSAVAGLSAVVRRHYFSLGKGRNRGWLRVRPEVREFVCFRRAHILELGSAFGVFDAIFCCNVMIYFEEGAVRQACQELTVRLVPGGHLFLGHTESARFLAPDMKGVASTVYRRSPSSLAGDRAA